MAELVLVRADDWEGLYADGKLLSEDHSIDPSVILNLIGGRVVYLTPQQDKKLCDGGGLPDTIAELETF